MSLGAHLKELRNRALLAVAGILVGAVAGWFLFKRVFELLSAPLQQAAELHGALISINFAGITSTIDVQLQVSLFIGVLISSPWWLYQTWAFITPGLKTKERRYTFAFVGAAVPLFLTGAVGAWLVLPRAVGVLTSFLPEGTSNLVDAQGYLAFVMRLLLAFGIALVLPVVMVGVNFAGLVSAKTWLKGWRWGVVGSFVFAAMMVPTPDPWTMVVVALPMCALYFGAVGICALRDKRVAKRYEAFIASAT